jgi:brefeldin A-resistance guanine nucleotide exchange factor 1
MSAFAKLRSDLKYCKDIQNFDAPSLLQPFLQVIRSSSTTAPITSLALIAITKMLAYRIIHPKMPNFSFAMQSLASTVTHCRFEGDNTSSDEVVFLRILKLMEDMICGASGDVLGDQSVCEMMECALSICCHLRMSEVLRRSAEISMVTMCQTIFARLKTLETEFGEEPTALEEAVLQADMDAAKIDSSPNGELGPDSMTKVRVSSSLDVPSTNGAADRPSMDTSASFVDLAKPTDTEVKPYGLPSIRELFRVLADLLDPHDRQRTDTLRVMALRIVNVALEVAGPSIANHPSLASLAKDTLCRNLFQLVRSENIAILHESLRVAGTLLATCRSVLKLQQELFLSYVVACLHPRVPIPDEPTIDPSLYQGVPQAPALVKQPTSGPESGRATPVPVRDRQKLGMEGGSRKPDAREAMVESIGGLVRIPSFMVELFVNYDCEIDRSDLCTDMVGLLSRNAFPDSATWSTTNVPPLCLDSLLGYVQFIADRLDDEPSTEDLPAKEKLQEQRRRKGVIVQGTTRFNESPRKGIAYLASQGIIEDPNDPNLVTAFLKGTARIDKRMLGEFISKRGSEAILDAFMDQFDFRGQRVDEALRQILNSFRLPGESALIERIVTVFSEKYFDTAEATEVADKDAIFILTYAIIMLNTDQYNPNIKAANRMTYTDFSRNLRGVNGGRDFEPQYLQDIHESIKTREIVLPEEHDNKHAFEHAWKELLIKTQTSERLTICTNTNIYDADMFAATWRPIVATLNYVFVSATEDAVFQRVTTGYSQLAQIAAKYGVHECLDHIILSLSKISTLAVDGASTALNTEIVAQGKSIMVSKFAVDFGRNVQAELATLVLFRVINGCEGVVRDGWNPVSHKTSIRKGTSKIFTNID